MGEQSSSIENLEPLDIACSLRSNQVVRATVAVSAVNNRRSRPVLAERLFETEKPIEFRVYAPDALYLQFDYAFRGPENQPFSLDTRLTQRGRTVDEFQHHGELAPDGASSHQLLKPTSRAIARFGAGFQVNQFNFLWKAPGVSTGDSQSAAAPPPAPRRPQKEGETREYFVWFGTNRTPVFGSNHIIDFGPERSDLVRFGRCRVLIPASHQIGSIGSKWWTRIRRGDDRIHVQNIRVADESYFWVEIKRALASVVESESEGIVFLHGYNTSFRDAARRAAQLGVDLSITGPMSFFSWPSKGQLASYFADEATIEASENQITEFLVSFVRRSGARQVHVIAHSMGSRALLRALVKISARASDISGTRFNQIVIAAADVDRDTFLAQSEVFSKVSDRTTMYVCRADRALGLSRWIHQYPRAGFTPPITVVAGVDTVSVGDFDLTTLGHGYVGEARHVLADIHSLFRHGRGPSDRFGLHRIPDPAGEYWQVST